MRREISVNHVVGFLGWRAFGFCRRWIYSSPGTLVTSLDVPVPIITSCSDSSASRSRCFPLEVAFPAPSDVTLPSIFFLFAPAFGPRVGFVRATIKSAGQKSVVRSWSSRAGSSVRDWGASRAATTTLLVCTLLTTTLTNPSGQSHPPDRSPSSHTTKASATRYYGSADPTWWSALASGVPGMLISCPTKEYSTPVLSFGCFADASDAALLRPVCPSLRGSEGRNSLYR